MRSIAVLALAALVMPPAHGKIPNPLPNAVAALAAALGDRVAHFELNPPSDPTGKREFKAAQKALGILQAGYTGGTEIPDILVVGKALQGARESIADPEVFTRARSACDSIGEICGQARAAAVSELSTLADPAEVAKVQAMIDKGDAIRSGALATWQNLDFWAAAVKAYVKACKGYAKAELLAMRYFDRR